MAGPEGARGNAAISKKGYRELEARLRLEIPDGSAVDLMLQALREVFRFDPSVNRYTPETHEHTRAWRARQKAARLAAQ
jgi:hypothetical protein